MIFYLEVKYSNYLYNEQHVEEIYYDNLSKEEPVEAIHSGKPFQSSIRDLVTNNSTEKKLDNDLFELKLVQLGDNDLLTRQLVENQVFTPNCARNCSPLTISNLYGRASRIYSTRD